MKTHHLTLSFALTLFACDGGDANDDATTESSDGADSGGSDVDEAAVQAVLDSFPEGFDRISAMPYPSQGHAAAVDVHVWVQELGAEAYGGVDPDSSGSNPAIPRGLVLIKEQFDNAGAVTGHTVMVKGPAGYASETGDWWWGFAGADKQLSNSGQIQFCIDCHAARPDDDWLYGVELDNRN